NVLVAKNLGIPTIIINSGVGKSLDELINSLYMAYDSFRDNGVEVLMVTANKVQPKNVPLVKEEMEQNLPSSVLVGVIPRNKVLDSTTVKEIVEVLESKILFGEEHINNQAGAFSVGAMQLRNYLTHLKENSLVITPGDRADIILGALQANISANYPSVSGIILTGGILPEGPIIQLIEGLSEIVP